MDENTTFWGLLPAMLLGGVGMSAAMAPTTAAAMQSVSPDKAGVGSAVLNSMRQVGGSLGIAIMGAIVAASVKTGGREPGCLPRRVPPRARDRRSADAARRGGRGSDARRAAAARARAGSCARRSVSARPRLPAEERRAAVLDTACRVFSRCSYRAATTAEIAREAGITEPILYRHFASKQALYLACIDDAWERIRAGVGRGGRSRARPGGVDAGDVDRVLPVQGAALGRGDALAARAHRVRRRPGDPQVPAPAPAGGARVRRRRPDAVPGGGGGAGRSAMRGRRRGSSSRSGCSWRSPGGSAGCRRASSIGFGRRGAPG